VRAVGLAAGLTAVGVAAADVFEATRVTLEERRAEGLHGDMQFTYRNPQRSTDPQRILPDAHSLVVGALSYRRQTPDRPVRPAGRVAAYAREDHYAELRGALGAMATWLTDRGHRARVVADDNALVDRAAAHRAGIGWYGKNSNVLLPGHGSWFVLGTVVTDAPLASAAGPVADGCGPCRRCLDGCPTGAIVAPGVVDARRCLAWLVQAAGTFPIEYREALGDRIYGCDDCQEVCPPNQRAGRRSDAPVAAPDAEAWVDLVDLLEAEDRELLDRHGRWYIAERDPRYLRRNALIALGNVGSGDDHRVGRTLDRYRDGDDELLAEHAEWATQRLIERMAVIA
jgi:epoxyqueuosine reductase